MSANMTAHFPLDAMPRAAGADSHPDQIAVLKSLGLFMLMMLSLLLFVPLWLDVIAEMSRSLSTQPWGALRGVLIGGGIVVAVVVAMALRVWTGMIKRLAQTDWAD